MLRFVNREAATCSGCITQSARFNSLGPGVPALFLERVGCFVGPDVRMMDGLTVLDIACLMALEPRRSTRSAVHFGLAMTAVCRCRAMAARTCGVR